MCIYIYFFFFLISYDKIIKQSIGNANAQPILNNLNIEYKSLS